MVYILVSKVVILLVSKIVILLVMTDSIIVKVLGMWHKPKSSVAITFVNNSISPNAFTSVCARFGRKLEDCPYGEAYRLMNKGYRRLSEIAWPVCYEEDAFDLIGQAYGSVETFFKLLEEQRIALDAYAHSCMDRGRYMEGIFLLLVAKSAIGWGKRFKDEYRNLDVRIKYR
jgi:hypothetical protein